MRILWREITVCDFAPMGIFFLFVYVAFFMMVVDDPVSSWGMQSPVMHGFMVYAADRRVRSIVF